MRILGIERDNTACNHYRVLQPLYKLKQMGMADILTLSDHELGTEKAMNDVLMADILVFQRPSDENWFHFIKLCQKHGKIIVTDYDDDPFNTSPFNPYYKFVGTKEWQYEWPDGTTDMIWTDGENGFDVEANIVRNEMFRSCFRKADMITTTTDILQEKFKTLNENTVILPNLMDFNVYRKYDLVKKDDEVRIGYQGGASHYEDIYEVRDAILEVIRKNDNAKLVYFGDLRMSKLFQDIPKSRIELHDWVQNIAYPYKLPLMNFDIGIAPLVDNEFNRNKSCLKMLDYATQKVPTVASNIPPYSPVIKDGETGFLVNNKKEWVDILTDLCKNKDKRVNVGNAAYDYVYEEYNADKKAHLWRDAYESLLKSEVTI